MRLQKVSIEHWIDTLADCGPDSRSTNRAHLKQMQHHLRLAIKQELTPRQRECVTLYFFHQLTEAEIGRQLGVGKSTVCRHLQKAKKRLHRSLRYTIS